MSGIRDEESIRELLRNLDPESQDDAASKSRVLNRTLDVFDEALNPGAKSAAADPRGSATTPDPAVVLDVFDEMPASVRGRRAGRILAVAATVAIFSVFALLRSGGEQVRTVDDGTRLVGESQVVEIDASEVLPGLLLNADSENVSVKRVEPGLMVLELRGDLSPMGGSTDLTLISAEMWGPALLPGSVPRVERPDSLNSWLAISGQDFSTYVPFKVADAQVVVESWRVRLGPGNDTCADTLPCGYVAEATGGGSISIIAGLTNELTSVSFPDTPTVLVHVAYSGDSQLSEPAGAEILRSMRIRQN